MYVLRKSQERVWIRFEAREGSCRVGGTGRLDGIQVCRVSRGVQLCERCDDEALGDRSKQRKRRREASELVYVFRLRKVNDNSVGTDFARERCETPHRAFSLYVMRVRYFRTPCICPQPHVHHPKDASDAEH